jgi:hypothetical protein
MWVNNKRNFSLLVYFVSSLIALTVPAAAQASGQPAVGFGMTSGRFMASSSAVIGLVGAVIGSLALWRPAGRFGRGRLGVIIALAAGVVSVCVGGYIVATAGGFGTGGGRAGAIVAVVLGLLAIVLGGIAFVRSGHAPATE